MGQHKQKPWDKRSWTVTPADGEPITVTTSEGATWALRALIAAGAQGLRPTDGAEGRFARHVDTLRNLGVEIEDMEGDEQTGRLGLRLACEVAAVEVQR